MSPELPEMNKGIDLSTLEHSMLRSPESKQDTVEEEISDNIVEQLGSAMITIEKSLASLHIMMKLSSTRIAQLENHIAYLLSKDDKAGPHIKKMMEAVEKQEASVKAEVSTNGADHGHESA